MAAKLTAQRGDRRGPNLEHHEDGFLDPPDTRMLAVNASWDCLDHAFEDCRSGSSRDAPEPSTRNTGTPLMASSGIDPSGWDMTRILGGVAASL